MFPQHNFSRYNSRVQMLKNSNAENISKFWFGIAHLFPSEPEKESKKDNNSAKMNATMSILKLDDLVK